MAGAKNARFFIERGDLSCFFVCFLQISHINSSEYKGKWNIYEEITTSMSAHFDNGQLIVFDKS